MQKNKIQRKRCLFVLLLLFFYVSISFDKLIDFRMLIYTAEWNNKLKHEIEAEGRKDMRH